MSCKDYVMLRLWMRLRRINFGGACKFLMKICNPLNATCFWILLVIFVVGMKKRLFKYGNLNHTLNLVCET